MKITSNFLHTILSITVVPTKVIVLFVDSLVKSNILHNLRNNLPTKNSQKAYAKARKTREKEVIILLRKEKKGIVRCTGRVLFEEEVLRCFYSKLYLNKYVINT